MASLWAARVPHLERPRLDGLRGPGRAGRTARLSGPAGGRVHRRRRNADGGRGAADVGAREAAVHRARVRRRRDRPHPGQAGDQENPDLWRQDRRARLGKDGAGFWRRRHHGRARERARRCAQRRTQVGSHHLDRRAHRSVGLRRAVQRATRALNMQAEPSRMLYAAPAAMHDFVRRLVAAHDVPEDDAEIVARCLVQADLRGVDTHGAVRLPGYLDRVRRGLIKARPNIEVRRVTPVAASVDGDDGFGFVVATRAMAEAIDMAKGFGIGIASARRSTHFGMAASYILQALDQGFVALVFSNASPAMPPWGGREALLGTNPFAAGVPGGDGGAYLLDMSPAVAARGKIRRAQRRGETIPISYALDPDGHPATDPAKALKGVVLPIGGAKGSGLAMLMDIFGGVLSGAAFAGG